MAITSNAAPKELSSSFYLENKEACEAFEAIILKYKGETKGHYNAWSYSIHGTVTLNYKWIFHHKKSTYSSGNLILPKHQNVLFSASWKAMLKQKNQSDFKIRKKNFMDVFLKLLKPTIHTLPVSNNYVIITDNASTSFITQLSSLLNTAFNSGEVSHVSYANSILEINFMSQSKPIKLLESVFNIS